MAEEDSLTSLSIARFLTAQQFRAAAENFLVRREEMHNLILGLTTTLEFDRLAYGSEPYFVVVRDGDQVVAASLMTPPHHLALSLIENEQALALIARDVLDFHSGTLGVIGPAPVSLRFARLWSEATGRSFRKSVAERIYKLETVIQPKGVAGQMRRAIEADKDLLLTWVTAFQKEALGEAVETEVERTVNRTLAASATRTGMFLWENPYPVSLVAYGGRTPNSMRIGPVYTPPEFRRHGYASACTAGASQYLLDSGLKFCTLFTDLANPTSNKIYQDIGYVPVGDVDDYIFE